MIINIYKTGQAKPQQYTYSHPETTVTLGRNPKPQPIDPNTSPNPELEKGQTILIDQPNASRTHLAIRLNKNGKLKVMDLGSANGTTVQGKEIQPSKWTTVQFGDEIVLGQTLGGKIVVRQRGNSKKQKSQSGYSSSSQSGSRSREKKNKNSFELLCKELKISESTLKMLKQMSSQKKSKEQKIKFLKLMGCKNVQANWTEIQEHLKGQNKYNNNNKKASDQLQKQFDSGRAGFEKKGLGRK